MQRALVAEMRRAWRQGLPLMVAQVLSVANGLVDTLVAGRIGPLALGAVAVGAGLVFVALIACTGLLAALSPTMAALRGQGRRSEVGVVFRQGLWLAIVLAALAFAAVYFFRSHATLGVDAWGLAPDLLPSVHAYLAIAQWSLPPAVLLLAARNVCEATGRSRQVLLVQVLGVLVNAVASVSLGLGVGLDAFGLEPLGIAGIAWATVVVQVITCLVLFLLLLRPTFHRFFLYRRLERPDSARLGQLLRFSAPISLMLLAEAGLFAVTGIQMAQFGAIEAGAHNIAITLTAVSYMIPLGLSFALTARTGTAYGRGWWPGIRLRAMAGLFLALPLALINAVVLVVFREPLASAFTDDVAVRQLAMQLFLLAAIFQVSDALQACLVGLLRGLHDTRLPMLINLLSYWFIGFGVGWTAANVGGFGPAGLWWGLIAGLSTSALLQGARLRFVLNRGPRRCDTVSGYKN